MAVLIALGWIFFGTLIVLAVDDLYPETSVVDGILIFLVWPFFISAAAIVYMWFNVFTR